MFGENLKRCRLDKGLSQSELAEKLFVTRQCVSKWEKGVTEPDLQTLTQISELLSVSVDALVNDDGELCRKKTSAVNIRFFIANILVAIFCILALIAVWKFMPPIIPAHWNAHGTVDRYGSRNEIFLNIITVIVFLIVDMSMFLVLRRVGDKRVAYISHGTIVLFQVGYLIYIVAMYARYISDILSFVTCMCAALIMCLSIAMHPKINKRNYLFGVRTASTLRSPQAWNKANAIACYLFASFSLIIFVINLIFGNRISDFVIFCCR